MNHSISTSTSHLNFITTSPQAYLIRANYSSIQPLTAYKFKGVGFSFAKSLKSTKSFGLSLKLPITANFPTYDSSRYLPRLGSSFGLNCFPFDYKFSLSMSMPLLTTTYGNNY